MSKREYDRNRAKKAYTDYKKRRAIVILSFGGVCNICKKTSKFFHFHHILYHPIESDYERTARDFWTRLKRLKEIEEHPERFELLCPGCHKTWESVLYLLKKIGREKLCARLA